jgi:hypothetical protein
MNRNSREPVGYCSAEEKWRSSTRALGFKDDHAQNAAEWIVYDALYAYCREMVKRGKPHGDFMG